MNIPSEDERKSLVWIFAKNGIRCTTMQEVGGGDWHVVAEILSKNIGSHYGATVTVKGD